MNHLDEGTIHTWLDGALDARQAADVQAHVDQCAACSARVAEARGLIAASSRILNALDDVPAGVTPKRAPAPPKMRRWASTYWVTGVAAALVVVALWRTTGMGGESPTRGLDIDLSKLDSVAVISLPAVPPVVEPLPAPLPAATPPTAQRAVAENRPAEGSAKLGRVAASVATGAGAGGEALRRDENRGRAPERQQAAEPVAVAALTDTSAMKDAAADGRASWSGCYRVGIGKLGVSRLDEVVVTSAPANVAAATTDSKRRAVRSSAPAPAPAAAGAASAPTEQKSSRELASEAATLRVLRLDTIPRETGFTVRSAVTRSDSTVGVWSEVSPDSARVQLPNRLAFTLAKSDRVACPQ
jgi:hypothetical protein